MRARWILSLACVAAVAGSASCAEDEPSSNQGDGSGAAQSLGGAAGAAASDGGTGGSNSGGSGGSDSSAGAGGGDTGGSSGGGGSSSGGSDSGGSNSGGSGGGDSGGANTGGANTGGTGTGSTGSGGSSNGACGWTYTGGGTLEDTAQSVLALDDGSVVVVGVTGSSNSPFGTGTGAFALRLSETGTLLWSKVYPGLTGPIWVAPGHGGKLVLAGTATSTDACEEHHGAQDAWVAEISPADGALGAHTCIGGDDDEVAEGVIARGVGVTAHYLVTGSVDSHETGNVGPNHNGNGAIDAPDILLGYWNPTSGDASGVCFGSEGIDRGTGFIDGDHIIAATSGDESGDFASQESFGYGDLAVVSLTDSDACTESPCATAVRLGGSANDAVLDADGSILVGTTASTDGDVGCPGASQTEQHLWIGHYASGDIPSHSCLSTGDTLGVSDISRGAGTAAVVGLAFSPTGEDFQDAIVDGTITSNRGAYILVYDQAALAEPAEIVVVGNNTRFNGVAVRDDGCVIAVGNRAPSTFGDVFVYTRQATP